MTSGSNISTPRESFLALVNALKTGDPALVKKVVTKKSYRGLKDRNHGKKIYEHLKMLGEEWSRHEFHVLGQEGKLVRGTVGDHQKAAVLRFIQTSQGWKLDFWEFGK